MEEVWKRIIKDQATIRYRQADFFSPYCEASVDSINKLPNGNEEITMNTFYRYDNVFLPLFEREGIAKPTKEWLLDCMMHLLTRLELRNGVNSREYATRVVMDKIEKNDYGKNMGQRFQELDANQQYKAAWFMEQQERNGAGIMLFAKAIIGILQNGVLYKSDENVKELILYMGREENEKDWNAIELAKEAYLPFDYRLRVFWNHSFGIIDNDKCMQIGNIEIY